MQTINDFPTYGMVSSWSTHEKLACPYCMENNKSFTLTHGGKAYFFIAINSSCQLITSTERIEKTSLLVEMKEMLQYRSSGEELYDMVSQYADIVFNFKSGKQKFRGFYVTYN